MADYNVKGKVSLDVGSFIANARQASDSLNSLDTSVNKTGSSMKYLKRGAIAAGVALGGLAMAGVKAASDYQQSMIAFTKMLGSAEKATQFVKELQEFAAKTPFELPQVQAGAKKLMAFGFEASQVLPMLTSIGDAASGLSLGSEGIDRLTLAIGQMQAKGKVSGGELRQLAEAGIPALQYLADAYGKTTAEILDMSEKGAIPAAAGVGILIKGMKDGSANAMGFSGMMEAQSKTMAGLMSTLKDTVRNAFVDGFNKYVPKISESFEGMITKVGPMVEKFIAFMGYLVSQIGSVLGGLGTIIKPIFENFLLPAIQIVGGAVLILLAAFAKFGDFLKKNAGAVEAFVNVMGVAALAIGAYLLQVKLVNLATIIFTKTMGLKAKVLKAVTKGQLMLNAAMRMNPIGLIVAALTLLIAGFITAWNNSEAFRKIMIQVGKAGVMAFGYLIKIVGFLVEGLMNVVTGPLKLLLKGLSLLGVDAAGDALKGINKMTKGVGDVFDKAGNKVQDFADKLDGLEKKKIKLPSFSMPKSKTAKPAAGAKIADDQFNFDASGLLGGADGAGKKTEKQLKEMANNLRKAVENYNDYLKTDFRQSFMNGAESAASAVTGALGKLEAVFEAKGKTLSGKALDKLRAGFEKVNAEVRAMIDGYAALAGEIEKVSTELERAGEALAQAVEERASAMKKFGDLMRTPFGEPSQIDKALRSAESTVDSIINMYDQLVEVVNQRFAGMSGTAVDAIKDFLYAQTNGLIAAARMRDKAIKVLEASQQRLEDLIDDQKSFSKTLTNSLKSFATGIADLSASDSKATITVVKTATGLVITQLKKSSSGLDTITKQLKDRLATIVTFSADAKKLLSSGLNKEYVRQLLEAGPEAAGLAVAALTTASAAQIKEINSLYEDIGILSDEFGSDISDKMYGEAIAMATAFRDGAAVGVELINAAMSDIVTNINGILAVLGNTGLTNAKALVDALVAEFTLQANTTVGPATQKVVEKIKETLGTLAATGLTNAQLFINGFIGALTGSLESVTASSVAIQAAVTKGTLLTGVGTTNGTGLITGLNGSLTTGLVSVTASATAIQTNINAIMALLSGVGKTNGLGLITALTGSLGGTNLTTVTAAATALNNSVTTALASLKTLGTNTGIDIAQGLVDKLAKAKADLVAQAAAIAADIASTMKVAASAIGVTVDDTITKIDSLVAAAAAAAAAVAASISSSMSGAADSMAAMLEAAEAAAAAADAASLLGSYNDDSDSSSDSNDVDKSGAPKITKIDPKKVVKKLTPKATQTPQLYGSISGDMYNAPGKNSNTKLNFEKGKKDVTVNISTSKVTQTLTATTIANAIKNAQNRRK